MLPKDLTIQNLFIYTCISDKSSRRNRAVYNVTPFAVEKIRSGIRTYTARLAGKCLKPIHK